MESQPATKTQQHSWKQCFLIAAGAVLLRQWAWGDDDPKATMLKFKDNPAAFKGKQVAAKMSYDGAGDRLADDVRTMGSAFLRAPFTFYTTAGVFDMRLLLPRDHQDVPQARGTDYLLVTFKCNTGELDNGNVFTSIRRY